ncbi:hypothetical protein [Aliikangiella maris]|uniref:Uncharacterized protein n=2 Tax=Aliikangiella maris TaxID=3162458 RepID=A0ABV2BSS1_9GAMM
MISVNSIADQAANEPQALVYLKPGESSERYFGDLKVTYKIDANGKLVTCTLYLATQLVGVHTLVKDDTVYNFDVQLANTNAKGKLTLNLAVYPEVSTLSGNFHYSVSANNESFTFIGDLVGWYVSP